MAEFARIFFYAIDQLVGIERRAMRGGAFLSRFSGRHDEAHGNVDEDPHPAGEHGQQHEQHPYPHRVDAEIRRQPAADASPHAAFGQPVHATRERISRRARAGAGPGARGRCARGRAFHRTHLGEDASDVVDTDDGLVRAEAGAALVADGLLQVREDLGPVRVSFQVALCCGQVVAQCVVAFFVNLVGVVVEIDRRDFAHFSFQAG
jgi:hypothetical protein